MIKIDLTGMVFGFLVVLHEHKDDNSKWLCKCVCKKEVVVISGNLTNGTTKSCGCYKFQLKKLEFIGQKFNKLTVIDFDKKKNNLLYWKCLCDCGNDQIISVSTTHLRNGHVKSCKCLKYRGYVNDLFNKKFGRLTVIEFSHSKNESAYWKCKCDCNKYVTVQSSNLVNGHTKSCGCYKIECSPKGEKHHNWNPDRDKVKLNRFMAEKHCHLIRRCLKRFGGVKNKHSYEILGYTPQELVNHLNIKELKDLDGMEIDHIFPIKAFVDYGITDPKIINALDNLQLITKEQNGPNGKWDKYDKKEFHEYLKNKNVEITWLTGKIQGF